MPRRRNLKNCLNCTRDAGKGNGAFEECPNGDFIRRIEGDAGSAAGFGSLVGQAKTGKSCEIRRFEAQLAQSAPCQRSTRCGIRSGKLMAYRMGSRISVTEICARILPSTNSTSEWTAD